MNLFFWINSRLMADAPAPTPQKKKSKWPFLLGGVAALLVAGWLFVSSGFFLRTFVLPKAGEALGGELQAGEAGWSPLSSVRLAKLRFVPSGQTEPLFTAAELNVEHDLFAIIGGTIQLSKVSLAKPVICLAKGADGKANYDAVIAQLNAPTGDTSAGPAQVNIANITVSGADFSMTTTTAGGQPETLAVQLPELTIDRLANGQPTQVKLTTALQSTAPSGQTIGATGEFSGTIQLGADLVPGQTTAGLQLAFSTGTGSFGQLNGSQLTAGIEAALPDVQTLTLKIQRGDAVLADATLSGRFDPATLDSDLNIAAAFQDGEWSLPIPGLEPARLQVGTTAKLDASVQLNDSGNTITASGKLTGSDTSLLANLDPAKPATVKKTDGLRLEMEFDAGVKLDEQTVQLNKLSLTTAKGEAKPLTATLAKPMTLALGDTAATGSDSVLAIQIDRLDLADWPSFVGQYASAGIADGTLNLTVSNGGRSFAVSLDSTVENLTIAGADPKLAGTNLEMAVNGKLEDWQKLAADKLHVAIGRGTEAWASFDGSAKGTIEEFTATGEGQINFGQVAGLFPVSGLKANAGSVDYSVTLGQAGSTSAITTKATVSCFDGSYDDWTFSKWDIGVDGEAKLDEKTLTIQQAKLAFSQQAKPQGELRVTGSLPLGQADGKLELTATGILAGLLNTVAQPWLAPVEVTQSQAQTKATVLLGADGSIALESTGALGQLMLTEGDKPLLAKPTTIGLALKTKLSGDDIALNQTEITLPKSDRGSNKLSATGKLSAPADKDISGSLKLSSDAVDLDSVIGLLPKNEAAATEGDFVNDLAGLPDAFAGLALDLQLQLTKAFWDHISIAKVDISGKASGKVIDLPKVQFELNGMPVTGSLRIDKKNPKPTYAFEVQLKDQLAQPLVAAIDPEVKESIAGKVTVLAKLDSSGESQGEFWANLKGTAEFKFTDGDLRVFSDTTKILLTPVAILLRLPEMLNSPIDSMHAKLKIENESIQLETCEVKGSMFVASATGAIALDETLEASALDLPVQLSVRRDVADKAGLIPKGTPLSAKFVKLPEFVKVGGTIGEPKTKTNKLAIVGLLGQSAAGLPGTIENKAGGLLENAANLLDGEFIGTDAKDALTNGGNNLFNNLNSLIGGEKDDKKKDAGKQKPVNPLNLFGPILSPREKPKKGDKPKE